MHHGVTIWANRSKILDRIDFVALPYFGNRYQVMNMYVTSAEGTIEFLKD